jgi:hypothetical protein
MVSVSAAAIEFACLHLGSVVAGFRRRAAHSSAVQETVVHSDESRLQPTELVSLIASRFPVRSIDSSQEGCWMRRSSRTHNGSVAGLRISRIMSRTLGLVAAVFSRAVAIHLQCDCSRKASAIVLISAARTVRPTRSRKALTLRLWQRPRRRLLPHGHGCLFARRLFVAASMQ